MYFNLFDLIGGFVIVLDKGLDCMFVFWFVDGCFIFVVFSFVEVCEGVGLCYVVFYLNGYFVYVVNELDFIVIIYGYDVVMVIFMFW